VQRRNGERRNYSAEQTLLVELLLTSLPGKFPLEVKMAPKLFNILLQRDDSNVQWGFRLSGGKDMAKPLTIVKVRN
jgi:hypothetical protein